MFKSDDGAANGWVRQQLSAMEANRSQYPMYDFIRKQGISQVDIAAVVQGHKKTHLVGANPMEASNANLQLTLHHNYYHNAQDRMPRLRAGNAHIFNIMMECSSNWEVKNRIPNEAAKLIAAEGFHFDVISNGSLSTEGGALLIEQSYINGVRYPLRNNQQSGTPAAYTGKIKAEALKYVLGDLEFTGGSSDPDSPLGPNQAPIIPFSWNGFTTLPYSYKADFVPAIMNRLNSPTDGAGAGILKWDSQNWLRTSY
jgi:pectate lyase